MKSQAASFVPSWAGTIRTCALSVTSILLVLAGASFDSRGAQYTLTILPAAAGTITFWPEIGLLYPQGESLQSGYFGANDVAGRQFRRCFLEFAVPREFVPSHFYESTVVSASLQLSAPPGGALLPLPAHGQEIGYYPGDLVVGTNDYDVTPDPLATFLTDPNDVEPDHLSFDVKEIVERFRGHELGFRIKLAVDPEYFDQPGGRSFATEFHGIYDGLGPKIVVVSSYPAPTIEVRTVRHVAVEPRKHGRTNDGLFVLTRTGLTNELLYVKLALEGTAKHLVDYNLSSDSLVSRLGLLFIRFRQGQVSAEIRVQALADEKIERPETVTLRLLAPTDYGYYYELGRRTHARLIILDRSRFIKPVRDSMPFVEK